MAKNLTKLAPAKFKEPWDHDFGERFSNLILKNRRVAYFYDQQDNSTFRYRVYNPCQTLNASDREWSGSFFFMTDLNHFDAIVDQSDVVILCRVKYSPTVASLVATVRAKGKRLLFDVDDLVFDADLAHFIANNNGYDLNHVPTLDTWFAYIARIGVTMRLCDGAITTNQFLAEQITRRTGLPAKVMCNYLNREQVHYSQVICDHKESQHDDATFKIGYFSGSPSHEHDFSVAKEALRALMRKHPHVHLVLVGYIARMAMGDEFKGRVRAIEFHDYVNLQRVIAAVDLNIAPLQQNIFTNCKSELKLFEASAVQTPTVASPTFTFNESITHGVDGYLAHDMGWFEQLDKIVTMPSDELRSVAKLSQERCLKRYRWDHVVDEVIQAFEPL